MRRFGLPHVVVGDISVVRTMVTGVITLHVRNGIELCSSTKEALNTGWDPSICGIRLRNAQSTDFKLLM